MYFEHTQQQQKKATNIKADVLMCLVQLRTQSINILICQNQQKQMLFGFAFCFRFGSVRLLVNDYYKRFLVAYFAAHKVAICRFLRLTIKILVGKGESITDQVPPWREVSNKWPKGQGQ